MLILFPIEFDYQITVLQGTKLTLIIVRSYRYQITTLQEKSLHEKRIKIGILSLFVELSNYCIKTVKVIFNYVYPIKKATTNVMTIRNQLLKVGRLTKKYY